MDAVDVRIFCEMTFRGQDYDTFSARKVSPSAIGRKLGLDEKTVRVRIRGMEERGFIKYYQVVPSLALLGMKNLSSFRFETLNLATKRNVLDHVQGMRGVVEAMDYLGRYVTISIAGASSQKSEEAAVEIARRFELHKVHIGDRLVREPVALLDRADWRIISELRYDALRPAKEIARALSITPRMAEYRIRKLFDSGAISVRAVIDPQRQEGLIFYQLEGSVERPKQQAFLRFLNATYGERLWSTGLPSEDTMLMNLFAFTLKEPEETVASLQQIEGVRRCSLFILKETIEPRRPNWIDGLIEEKASQIPG